MDQHVKKCQTEESLEDCTTEVYQKKLRDQCQCVPFGLKNLTDKNQGKIISLSLSS